MTALMWAAKTGQGKVVQCLVDAKADVNVEASNGETALRIARRKHYRGIARQLIAAGAHE
jgi:ankyrin repeat protein